MEIVYTNLVFFFFGSPLSQSMSHISANSEIGRLILTVCCTSHTVQLKEGSEEESVKK